MRTFGPTLLILAMLAIPAAAAEIRGAVGVVDGRTLLVAGQTVRLHGIDAPDLAQTCDWGGRRVPCGTLAKTALMDLTAGVAEVVCRQRGEGENGAVVAVCSAEGFDLGGNMVHTGWALAGPGAPSRYREIEAKARAAERGLWRGRFVAPAEWRRGRRLSRDGG